VLGRSFWKGSLGLIFRSGGSDGIHRWFLHFLQDYKIPENRVKDKTCPGGKKEREQDWRRRGERKKNIFVEFFRGVC